MDQAHNSFRSLEPEPGASIVAVCWSTTGSHIATAPSSPQFKVYNRDGAEILQSIRGDMYIKDMAHTKGHVAALTSISWHPHNGERILTSSVDGTLRLWDMGGKMSLERLTCLRTLKLKGGDGRKSQVGACQYNPTGKVIGAACEDGSVQVRE